MNLEIGPGIWIDPDRVESVSEIAELKPEPFYVGSKGLPAHVSVVMRSGMEHRLFNTTVEDVRSTIQAYGRE